MLSKAGTLSLYPPYGLINSGVVPAKAGTHNHRCWLFSTLELQRAATLKPVVMGPGSRSLCSLVRDDSW